MAIDVGPSGRIGGEGFGRESGWMLDALCQEYDRELFFPARGKSSVEAKRLCGRCLVQRECREYALADPDLMGIWGGTSTTERAQLRRTMLHEVA